MKRTITIWSAVKNRPVKLRANVDVIGLWAVHPEYQRLTSDGWTVTHVPSGAGIHYLNREQALRVRAMLLWHYGKHGASDALSRPSPGTSAMSRSIDRAKHAATLAQLAATCRNMA